jgi:hypothetical protein
VPAYEPVDDLFSQLGGVPIAIAGHDDAHTRIVLGW